MDSIVTGNHSTGRLRMEIYVCLVNVFMYVILPIAVLKMSIDFFKDVRKMWIKDRKNSTEGKSAERDKIKHSNYNISKKRNINNLDRWE
jgi:hypothetical protein